MRTLKCKKGDTCFLFNRDHYTDTQESCKVEEIEKGYIVKVSGHPDAEFPILDYTTRLVYQKDGPLIIFLGSKKEFKKHHNDELRRGDLITECCCQHRKISTEGLEELEKYMKSLVEKYPREQEVIK